MRASAPRRWPGRAWPSCLAGRLRLLDPAPVRSRHPDGLRAGLPLDHIPPRRELQLTELVNKEIERRTPFKVVGTPEGADTILDGTINFADKNIIVENPFNLPRQLIAMLHANVTLDAQPARSRRSKTAAPVVVSENVQLRPGSRRDVDDRLLAGEPEASPSRSST